MAYIIKDGKKKKICDWEIFVSMCSGSPVVTTFVHRHKCKFRHKNKSVTSTIAGHNKRTCPSRKASQGTQNDQAEIQNQSIETSDKCGSYGILGHNEITCPFIELVDGVVDLASNFDDLSNVVQLDVDVKRKVIVPDEGKTQSDDLNEDIVAEIKAIEAEAAIKIEQLTKKQKVQFGIDAGAEQVPLPALRKSPRKKLKDLSVKGRKSNVQIIGASTSTSKGKQKSMSQPIKILKNAHLIGQDVPKVNRNGFVVIALVYCLFPFQSLSRPANPKPTKLRGKKKIVAGPVKEKKKGKQNKKSGFQLIDEPLDDIQEETRISEILILYKKSEFGFRKSESLSELKKNWTGFQQS
ncbi:OLC1v1016476C1 [Oldenlandia corymbosa var. corymbosa]|uniref:OLC1v1016476C1 n=1 Tax=Oldenlandia corymbosa var. corymbosa TaxID=529605 RepID=A0AAV1E732_OLDCO|nr:OLC1v1016476C1 [Oldenlandia corymbosa var. corymbosa]